MSLADKLQAAPKPSPFTSICSVKGLASRLSKKDRKAFLAAASGAPMASGEAWSVAALSRMMTEAGYPIKESPLGRHRRGDCQCPKA